MASLYLAWFTDRARTTIAIVVICGFVVASYAIGISRGMDHKIGWGPLNEMWHLTNAISDNVYGLNHGYVGFGRVFESLREPLSIKDWALDPKQIPTLEDKAVLNEALRKAASLGGLSDLGPLFPPSLETFQHLYLVAPNGEDLGESAYFSLAFRLFGLRIKSAYYLFFVMIGLSIAAFLVQFRRDPAALALLLFNVLAFHVFFYVEFFSPFIPTVYINRFASVLCIIPVFHFVFLLLERRRPSLPSIGLAVLQLAILLFALFIRSSGTWAIMGIVALIVAQLLIGVVKTHGQAWRARIAGASRSVRYWPVLLLLAGFAGFLVYRDTAPHPLFRTIDDVPHHMRWHSAWLGLALHPDWPKYHPEQPGISDSNAFNEMTLAHLRAAGLEQEFISPYTHQPRIGLHESYIRLKYLQFVRQHPSYIFQLLLYYKPRAFVQTMTGLFSSVDLTVLFPMLAAIVATIALGVARVRPGAAAIEGTGIAPAVGATALLFLFSLLPVIWAYPALFVMSDQIWMTTVAAATLIWAAVHGGLYLFRRCLLREDPGLK